MPTKSEQTILDTVKSKNDAGLLSSYPVEHTKGAKCSWRSGGGYARGPEKKASRAAFDSLLASGAIVETIYTNKFGKGYALAGHPILSAVAADMDLEKLIDAVSTARKGLQTAEDRLTAARAFVEKHTRGAFAARAAAIMAGKDPDEKNEK